MNRDAAVLCHNGIEQRHVHIDEMQLDWVACCKDVPREIASVSADLCDARLPRQVLHQLIARRADAAVREQLRRNGQ